MDYKDYGLKENPFPPPPAMLNPFSNNPKINGRIFASTARQKELNLFENAFIHPDSFENRYRLGFLWAKGDPETRGQGKTAFLVYLRHQINDGWGKNYVPASRICAVYVSFPQQVKDYPLEHISQLALVSCIRDGIFAKVKSDLEVQAQAAGVHISEVANWVRQKLEEKHVDHEFAAAIASGTAYDYLRNMRKDRSLDIPRPPRDTYLLTRTNSLFFTYTVRALQAAGFAGGYIFIDDIENITDLGGRKHLETFAKNLGIILFRSDSEQAIGRFFTVILTTHLSAAARLSYAWASAGLASVYPMDPQAKNSIELPALVLQDAKEIFTTYLKHSQIADATPPGLFHPFEEDAVNEIITKNDNHPRKFLSAAHDIIESARSNKVSLIDKKFAQEHLKRSVERRADRKLPELTEL